VLLVAIDPGTGAMYRFVDDAMVRYQPPLTQLPLLRNVEKEVLATADNLPVMRVNLEEQA
jgi:hypothetical protein